jgi:hypothetical protein
VTRLVFEALSTTIIKFIDDKSNLFFGVIISIFSICPKAATSNKQILS